MLPFEAETKAGLAVILTVFAPIALPHVLPTLKSIYYRINICKFSAKRYRITVPFPDSRNLAPVFKKKLEESHVRDLTNSCMSIENQGASLIPRPEEPFVDIFENHEIFITYESYTDLKARGRRMNIDLIDTEALYSKSKGECHRLTNHSGRPFDNLMLEWYQIYIESKTANALVLQSYISHLLQSKKSPVSNYELCKPVKQKNQQNGQQDDDQPHINIVSSIINTYSNLSNVIYSEKVKTALFGDVEHFMKNISWYIDRNVAYKRNYLLYGPPGTGKTTIPRIIASTYDIPIFYLDLSVMNTPDLIESALVAYNNRLTDALVSNKNNIDYYILLIEDIDRYPCFTGDNSEISLSFLLNMLDGPGNPTGRIVIMTANDVSKIANYEALNRPGRIDKAVLINYCDEKQIAALYKQFYQVKEAPAALARYAGQITPAELLNMMYEYKDDAAMCMRHLATHAETTEKPRRVASTKAD